MRSWGVNNITFFLKYYDNRDFVTGKVCAIDINEGRLRILQEAAKSHQVDGVITTINMDLRNFAVS